MGKNTKSKTKKAPSDEVEILNGHHTGRMVREADPDGRIVTHTRALDVWPLDRMLRSGTIDADHYKAGDDFRRDYEAARMATHYASINPDGGGGGGGRALDYPGSVAARRRVAAALACIGGDLSRSIVEHVVGDGIAISEWVTRVRFGTGRPVNAHFASGLLVGALDRLAYHFGHKRERHTIAPAVPKAAPVDHGAARRARLGLDQPAGPIVTLPPGHEPRPLLALPEENLAPDELARVRDFIRQMRADKEQA